MFTTFHRGCIISASSPDKPGALWLFIFFSAATTSSILLILLWLQPISHVRAIQYIVICWKLLKTSGFSPNDFKLSGASYRTHGVISPTALLENDLHIWAVLLRISTLSMSFTVVWSYPRPSTPFNYICLMAFFQDNLGNLAPERQNNSGF